MFQDISPFFPLPPLFILFVVGVYIMRPFPVSALVSIVASGMVEDIFIFVVSNTVDNGDSLTAIIEPVFELADVATLLHLAIFASEKVNLYKAQNRSIVWVNQARIIQDVANNELYKRGYTPMRNAVSVVKGKVQGLFSALKIALILQI